MGVHGLWKLIEPSGKPVPLESLENKVLAVDISVWLHQVMKGYQDSTGNALPNAHLLGLFHRICKLLFYKIRPVFVFDGGVPQLKLQTLASRRQQRSRAARRAEQERLRLLRNLAEQGAVRQALGAPIKSSLVTALKKPSVFADFILEPLPETVDSSDEEEWQERSANIDWDTFDPDSEEFKKRPANERLEILTDLKEARKQNSWGRIHEMPQESSEFSGFQLRRLLVRRSAQVGLEEVEKELGERHTLTMSQLEDMMQERGSLAQTLDSLGQDMGRRIVSDTSTRFILVKNSKEGSQTQSTSSQEVSIIHQESQTTSQKEGEVSEELSQSEILSIIQSSTSTRLDNNAPSTSSSGYYVPVSEYASTSETIERVLSESPPLNTSSMKFIEQSTSHKDKVQVSQSLKITSTLSTSYVPIPELPSNLIKSIGEIKVPNKKLKTVIEELDLEKNSKEFDSSDTEDDIIEETVIAKNKSKSDTLSLVCPSPVNIASSKSNKIISVDLTDNSKPVQSNIEKNEELNAKTVMRTEIENSLPLNIDKEIIKPKSQVQTSPIAISESDESSGDDFEEVCSPSVSEVDKKESLEIKINPNAAAEDDLFADIFTKPQANTLVEKVDKVDQLEIKINTSAEDENDIFADVFEVSSAENIQQPTLPQEAPELQAADSDDLVEVFVQEQLAATASEQKQVTEEDLVELEAAGREMAGEAGRQERLAATVSEQMCLEARELLKLFGLPWVIAPMEAEAQCATLELLKLTQGTVTDDSDVWLFGGRTVYRNFFNQSRHVEMYTSDAIHRCFKLSRQQLVLLAMLVGSDYTNGLQGVGPVTALEILASFPSFGVNSQQAEDVVKPLWKFKEWYTQENSTRLRKLANKLKNLELHDGFPSEAVADAYLHPAVDDSSEVFSWGSPNVPALIDFAREKFGWNRQRCESILNPVIKRLGEKVVQTRLDTFFTVGPKASRVDGQLSSRVREAVSQLGAPPDENQEEIDTPSTSSAVPTTDNSEPSTSSAAVSDTVPKRKPAGRGRAVKPQLSTLQNMRKALTKKPRSKKLPERPTVDQASPSNVQLGPNRARPGPSLERIPQREKDRDSALQSKMKAIEVFRKRKLDATPRDKKAKRVTKEDHYLSESSDEN